MAAAPAESTAARVARRDTSTDQPENPAEATETTNAQIPRIMAQECRNWRRNARSIAYVGP